MLAAGAGSSSGRRRRFLRRGTRPGLPAFLVPSRAAGQGRRRARSAGRRHLLMRGFGLLGATLFLLALFLVAVTLATGLVLVQADGPDRARPAAGVGLARDRSATRREDWSAARAARAASARWCARSTRSGNPSASRSRSSRRSAPIEKSERAERETADSAVRRCIERMASCRRCRCSTSPSQQRKGYSEETLEALSRQVEFKLKDFRIEAEVVGVHPGPGDHALRDAAGARHQGQPDQQPGQGHRARAVGHQRARGRRDSRASR